MKKLTVILKKYDDEEYIGEFTFIEDEEDLKCEQTGFKLITCQVPKKHFKGKETGLYFIKHKNHINKKSTSYEVPPIKVILPSKENIISSSLFYSLLLFLIMIYFKYQNKHTISSVKIL